MPVWEGLLGLGRPCWPGKALLICHAVGLTKPCWPGKALHFYAVGLGRQSPTLSCCRPVKAVLLAWLPGPTYYSYFMLAWEGPSFYAIGKGWRYWPGKALLLAWLPHPTYYYSLETKSKTSEKSESIHQSHQLQVVSSLQDGVRKEACSICSTKALGLKRIGAPKHLGTLLLCHFKPQLMIFYCFQTSVL